MKKLLIIAFLMSNCAIAFSQSVDDNTIVIRNYLEQKDLSTVKRILITNGYEFYEIDTTEGYFSTQPHPIEGSVYAYNLNLKIFGVIEGKDLILSANYTSQYSNGTGGMADASGRATYHKRKLIAKKLAFDELQRIALKIGPNLEYLKK